MEEENIYILKVILMKVNIKMVTDMAKEPIFILMVIDIKVVGNLAKKMVLEYIIILIKQNILAILKMI